MIPVVLVQHKSTLKFPQLQPVFMSWRIIQQLWLLSVIRISRGIKIRYELPTVRVFYDKFINLSAVTVSSYDPLRYVFINLFILGNLLRFFDRIIIKCQMVGLCVNWSGCGFKQLLNILILFSCKQMILNSAVPRGSTPIAKQTLSWQPVIFVFLSQI